MPPRKNPPNPLTFNQQVLARRIDKIENIRGEHLIANEVNKLSAHVAALQRKAPGTPASQVSADLGSAPSVFRPQPASPASIRARSVSPSARTSYAEGAMPLVNSPTSPVESVRVRLRSLSRPTSPTLATEAGRREYTRLVGAPRVAAAQVAMAGRSAPRASRSTSST